MQDLKVALVQAEQVWENKAANLSHYDTLLNDVTDVQLILLPEMFHTGFSMNAKDLAETMEESMGLDWLRQTAQQKNTAIYTSLIIQENGNYYNRGVFVQPDGSITSYNKRQVFGLAGEDLIYTAGTKPVIVNYLDWNFQLQICYDLRFPEIVRNKMASNQSALYDVILYVANWPHKRNVHWITLLTARAIENQSYVLGVNRVGTDGLGITYSGDSLISSPLGEVNSCEESKEVVSIFKLSKANLLEVRQKLPFLKDKKG
jgi:omega-amidase